MKNTTDTTIKFHMTSKNFKDEIHELCGENAAECYQCGKCTAGCPAAFAMDITPNNIIRLIQLGLKDEVLKSKTIWTCTSCETCATRCPCGVALSKIMDAARQIAIREGVKPGIPEVYMMHDEILRQISWHGRTHELGMMGIYKLRSMHLTDDVFKGIQMMIKGKLGILPGRIKKPKDLKALFGKDDVR